MRLCSEIGWRPSWKANAPANEPAALEALAGSHKRYVVRSY